MKKKIAIVGVKVCILIPYMIDKIFAFFWKKSMKHCGRGVYLRPMSSDIKGFQNLSIGDWSSIPKRSVIYCTEAPLTIGRKVIFGPNPTIITGDHRIDIVGKFMIDVTVEEKLPQNDEPVIIEDDAWCGANVTILKGVTIGRGSVIAAGAVVTKDIPPYCIAGGIPAKPIKFKWTIDQILEHERKCYPEDERFTRLELEKIFSETSVKVIK